VTILGWLLVLGGLARILFPIRLAAAAGDFAHSLGTMGAIAAILVAFGAFLSFKAHTRS
jgi:hypothetical protein